MSILFSDIDYLAEDSTIKHGYVLVEEAQISYVGSDDPRSLQELQTQGKAMHDPDGAYVVSGTGKLLMPGLYNTHTHIPMTLLRGYAEGLPLADWLNKKVFPFEALITTEAALPASELAIAEMLRFGTVSFSDMYDFTEERVQAVDTSGIKANLSFGPVVFDPELRYEDMPRKQQIEQLVRTYHQTCEGRLKIDIFVHSEYLSNPSVVREVSLQAQELNVNTHIHLSETQSEHEEAKERRGGLTPTQYFDSLGFFEQPCTAAHAVWTEPEDWAILAARGVTVAHNPCSNAKLGSGIAPVAGMLAAGVNVGLGTDGVASNNNHNLFKELYTAALLPKARELDASIVTPEQVLAMATKNGAWSQRRHESGVIAPGNAADLLVLDTSGPWMEPVHSQVNNLVYAAQGNDVIMTLVDGKILYNKGEWTTIDVERAAAQTSKAAHSIVAQL